MKHWEYTGVLESGPALNRFSAGWEEGTHMESKDWTAVDDWTVLVVCMGHAASPTQSNRVWRWFFRGGNSWAKFWRHVGINSWWAPVGGVGVIGRKKSCIQRERSVKRFHKSFYGFSEYYFEKPSVIYLKLLNLSQEVWNYMHELVFFFNWSRIDLQFCVSF